MNINLPYDMDQFVRELVIAGKYPSEDAAVTEGLRLLLTREKLRADVAAGFKQIDDGQWIDGDEVFAELYATIDAIEAGKA